MQVLFLLLDLILMALLAASNSGTNPTEKWGQQIKKKILFNFGLERAGEKI